MSDFKRGCLAFVAGVVLFFGGLWGCAWLTSLDLPAWTTTPLQVTGFVCCFVGVGAACMGWAYAMASRIGGK